MDKSIMLNQIEQNTYRTQDGLSQEVFLFTSTSTSLINVDLLVFDKDKGVLLAWRDDEHCGIFQEGLSDTRKQ